jgi:hypothetical protein
VFVNQKNGELQLLRWSVQEVTEMGCINYRGTSLFNTAYKIYAKISTQWVNAIAETMLLDVQNRSMKGRSCMDRMYIVK